MMRLLPPHSCLRWPLGVAAWALLCGCAATPAAPPEPALDRQMARLVVEGPPEAVVHLDGEPAARLPLDDPLVLEPGRHFVALTLDGTHPHGETVELPAQELTTLSVTLDLTAQRIASSVLLAVGGGGLAGGIGLGAAAVVERRRADDVLEEIDGLPSREERRSYDQAIARSDDRRLAAGIAGGSGLAIFLVGGALFVLDSAEPPAAMDEPRDEPPETSRPLGVAPALSRNFAGAFITGEF